MKIEHIGILTNEPERLKFFYITYFEACCTLEYTNRQKNFRAYFLEFESGSKLEIMSFSLRVYQLDNDNVGGLHHFCFAVETIDEVDQCISRLKDSEATIIELPRFSGLGDYVATILDPDGNRIEIIKKFQ